MTFKKEIRLQVYNKFNGHCAYCGEAIEYKDMQVDHITPQRNGGTDDLANLFPTCRLCNHYKRAAGIEAFRELVSKIPTKQVRDNYVYKVGVKYGFLPSENQEIEFYFEKVEVENSNV